MRKDMKRKNDRLVALLGAVLCACACLVGCERKEAALPEPSAPAVTNAPVNQVVSRENDAVYQAKVQDRLAVKRRTQVDHGKILALKERLRARARKNLPAGATEEQVTAEIEGNPRKYPGWQELNEALVKNGEKAKRDEAATYTMVRRRVLREAAGQTPEKQ